VLHWLLLCGPRGSAPLLPRCAHGGGHNRRAGNPAPVGPTSHAHAYMVRRYLLGQAYPLTPNHRGHRHRSPCPKKRFVAAVGDPCLRRRLATGAGSGAFGFVRGFRGRRIKPRGRTRDPKFLVVAMPPPRAVDHLSVVVVRR
jgi:hypothetical protein